MVVFLHAPRTGISPEHISSAARFYLLSYFSAPRKMKILINHRLYPKANLITRLVIAEDEYSLYVGSRDEYKSTFTSMLQLLFYLCSDEPDMPEIEHPQKRRTLSGGVRAPEEPRVWDVGVRISNVIRRYKNSGGSSQPAEGYEPGSHASPRPHVRSAHWHTYWIGPRQAAFPERKPILKWIPPIPIGMDWKRELPTTIRNVVNG